VLAFAAAAIVTSHVAAMPITGGSPPVVVGSTAIAVSPPSRVERWRETLAEIDIMIRAGEHAAAEKPLRRLIAEMAEHTGVGEGAAYTLAVSNALLALAEYGQGERDEAAWRWNVALALFPTFSDADLSPYGDAVGELSALAEKPFEAAREVLAPDDRLGLERPRKIKSPKPSYPRTLRQMRIAGTLVVAAVVTAEGRIARPRFVNEPPAPALGYLALEALRDWRFEPARYQGRAISVQFMVKIDWDLR
jgi:TonB family protein